MSTKAPRILASVWDGYKEEITASYTAPNGTLEKVMNAMKEKYGFQPTSQYLTKLKHWGLQKYANALDYTYADQKIKKRAREGKDTAFDIRGKKMSHIPTPEGVQVFTPSGEENSDYITLEASIDNSPWSRLQKDSQTFSMHESHVQFFPSTIYNMLEPHTSQLKDLHNSHFGANLLQMAIGDNLIFEGSNMFVLIQNPYSGKQQRRSLSSYFPPSDVKIGTIWASDSSKGLDMLSRFPAVQRFLRYFVRLTNNDALENKHIFNAVNWLLKAFDRSLFTNIFDLRTNTAKIFMRKILAASVNSGDTKLVEEILGRGIILFHRQKEYLSSKFQNFIGHLITIAVQNQDQPMLQLLCRAGFRTNFFLGDKLWGMSRYYVLNIDSLLNRTFLPWITNNSEILETLLTFKADPDSMLRNVSTGFPLINAAESGNIGVVDMLLKAGSSVNIHMKDYFGTPLQAAIHAEHIEVAKLLIENGADVNVPYAREYKLERDPLRRCRTWRRHHCVARTPIQIACEMNNIRLVELLLAHQALVDFSPLSQLTANDIVHLEKTMNDFAEPKSMSAYLDDYSPHYTTIPYLTALQYSVRNRNLSLVHLLLAQGADPDSRVIPDWGDTPLQMAARLNYPEIMSVLMKNGADINALPGRVNGRTTLQAAVEGGNLEMVQLLLQMNAEVNAPAGFKRGLTALQAAIKNDHSEIAELLLRSNADIDAPPSLYEGLSAIETAISRKNLFHLEFLLDHASGETILNGVPTICAAAKFCWIDGARYLLKRGSNVNSFYYVEHEQGRNGLWGVFSPLIWAIIKQNLDMVKLLIDSGAEANLHLNDNRLRFRENDALCHALGLRCSHETEEDDLRPIIDWVLEVAAADKSVVLGHATMFREAVKNGKIGLAMYLRKTGADTKLPPYLDLGLPFAKAIHNKELDAAHTLQERRTNRGAREVLNEDFRALEEAARTGNIKFAAELLRRRACFATVATRLVTAINIAAQYGREDMLHLFLDHYDGNDDFRHVCHIAAVHAETAEHPEIAEWLRGYAVARYDSESQET